MPNSAITGGNTFWQVVLMPNGVLTGTVSTLGTGPLSGLIGQDNAVGVFYNNELVGGFVAGRNIQAQILI